MLLAIDIGNTNITFGIFRGSRLLRRFDLPTRGYTRAALSKRLKGACISEAVICSVVPESSRRLNRDIKSLTGRQPYNIGKDIVVPIKNLYRKPAQVGQDRLVNAFAAARLFKPPLVVVDFGTAVTFDVVSRQGAYLGGMIIPGLGISARALAEETALLPQVRLSPPQEFIGKDTKNSILSGLVYGFAALTDGVIARIRRKIGRQAQVLATGGNALLVSRYSRAITRVDPELTLKGLSFIFQERRR